MFTTYISQVLLVCLVRSNRLLAKFLVPCHALFIPVILGFGHNLGKSSEMIVFVPLFTTKFLEPAVSLSITWSSLKPLFQEKLV